MTTTEPQARPTDDQLRTHSSWCDTTRCEEGTRELEFHHQSSDVGEVVTAGAPFRRATVSVDRHAVLEDGGVSETTTVDLTLEPREPGGEPVYCSFALDQADQLTAHISHAVATARNARQ